MFESVTENEAFFDRSNDSIVEEAPEGSTYVVIANSAVVGYYGNRTDGLKSWGARKGAILKSLAPQAPCLVASNFLPH